MKKLRSLSLRRPRMRGGRGFTGLGQLTTGATAFSHLTIRITDEDRKFLEQHCEGGDSVNRFVYLLLRDQLRERYDYQLSYVPKRIRQKDKEDE